MKIIQKTKEILKRNYKTFSVLGLFTLCLQWLFIALNITPLVKIYWGLLTLLLLIISIIGEVTIRLDIEQASEDLSMISLYFRDSITHLQKIKAKTAKKNQKCYNCKLQQNCRLYEAINNICNIADCYELRHELYKDLQNRIAPHCKYFEKF